MIRINDKLLSETSSKAQSSKRRRMNFNFHKEASANLQRMLNAMEPDTYIQPHKHEDPDKEEVFFVLRGRIVLIEFDDDGNIIDHEILDPLEGNYGGEISARKWHTLISLEEGSVAYEVKDGPYNPIDDKNFASWAPKEGDADCLKYNQELLEKLMLSKQ